MTPTRRKRTTSTSTVLEGYVYPARQRNTCQTCQSRNPGTSNSTAPLATDSTSGAAAEHGRCTSRIHFISRHITNKTLCEARNSFLPHGSVSERGQSDFDCRDPSQPLQFGSVHCTTGSAMMGHTHEGVQEAELWACTPASRW